METGFFCDSCPARKEIEGDPFDTQIVVVHHLTELQSGEMDADWVTDHKNL